MPRKRKHETESETSMYSCLQCSSKFKQKFNLTKHIKSVHNLEKLKCNQCEAKYSRSDNLKRHKQMKHTLKKCDECEFSTYKNCELANHMP